MGKTDTNIESTKKNEIQGPSKGNFNSQTKNIVQGLDNDHRQTDSRARAQQLSKGSSKSHMVDADWSDKFPSPN